MHVTVVGSRKNGLSQSRDARYSPGRNTASCPYWVISTMCICCTDNFQLFLSTPDVDACVACQHSSAAVSDLVTSLRCWRSARRGRYPPQLQLELMLVTRTVTALRSQLSACYKHDISRSDRGCPSIYISSEVESLAVIRLLFSRPTFIIHVYAVCTPVLITPSERYITAFSVCLCVSVLLLCRDNLLIYWDH